MQHVALGSRLCGSLDGRGFGGNGHTCMDNVSLCCPSETITALLVNWLYPKIKSSKEKKKNYELEIPFWEVFVASVLNVERLTLPGSS